MGPGCGSREQKALVLQRASSRPRPWALRGIQVPWREKSLSTWGAAGGEEEPLGVEFPQLSPSLGGTGLRRPPGPFCLATQALSGWALGIPAPRPVHPKGARWGPVLLAHNGFWG